MASEFMLKLLIGVIAFGVLFVFWLMVGTDLYEALFPPETTAQDLADRIEYLACGGGFGIQKNCSQQQYVRNVVVLQYPRDLHSSYSQALVIFTEPGQTLAEHYTNPCDGPCLCWFRDRTVRPGTELEARSCEEFSLPQEAQVYRVADEPVAGYPSTENWSYAAPVFATRTTETVDISQIGTIEVPESTIVTYYVEYNPGDNPYVLFTPLEDSLWEREPPESST